MTPPVPGAVAVNAAAVLSPLADDLDGFTAALLDEPTPLADRPAKHREDLLDAALCAWTGLVWLHHGFARCQVLGTSPSTVIAPCRPEQRR